MVFPAFSGRFASSKAAHTAAPEEMPTSTPALRARGAARRKRILVLNRDDLVVDGGVEHLGHKARADALDGVRARRAAREDRRARGLDRDDVDVGVLGLEVATHAGDGTAGAHARDEDVDRPIGVLPNLRAGGRLMRLGA